jgi:hypothetical protein
LRLRPDAAALLSEVDWVPLAPVTTHMREPAVAAVVLALAGPESRALRGKEAVVLAGFNVCLQFATGAGCGEGGGGEGGDGERELHDERGGSLCS